MKNYYFKSKITILFVFTILLNSFSCKKDEFSQVPYAMVDFKLNVYNELSGIGAGQYIFISAGSSLGQILLFNPYQKTTIYSTGTLTSTGVGKGIILYHYNYEEWYAYDNTCTYQPQTDNAAIEIQSDGTFAICPKCKSKFLLLDGSPQSGSKAPRPLKLYKAIFDSGTGYLIVNN